jgi:sec-independent protein translocase protein TatA
MGPLGAQELVVIFILALLLFGPKKLPELGRTIGKAMTEFRRAQAELKSTFDREMQNIERETGVKELAAVDYKTGSYDYSSYDSSYYDSPVHNSTSDSTQTASASATEGAGSTAAVSHVETIHVEPAAGSIASGYANNAAIAAFGGERPVHEPSIAPDGPTVEKTIHS